jgi:tRNA A-37 threonylcarbamoyl transferase component Bud32
MMARVRNIGLPVNDSERKAISYFVKALPDDYILLTNLELPTLNGFPYEFDIIVIGRYAVCVIELKGYGGIIKGNAYEWELSSGKVVKSPLPLLHTKTKVVAGRITTYSPSLSDVWVGSLLVLTEDRVKVEVDDPFSTKIKTLDESVRALMEHDKRSTLIAPEKRRMIEEAIAKQFLPLRTDKEIGEYRLIEQVGHNELYTTFIAEHRLLGGGKRYLLKVYTLKIYDDLIEQKKHQARVLREANALFELPPHPNLVRANHPFAEGDVMIVLPLEWVDGRSLRGSLDDRTTARNVPVKAVLIGLCSVLSFIHQHGVVHRDLRPENVIVCPDGSIRLVNFDCAHLGGQDMRTIATRVGRHLDERYVAPEVWMDPANGSKSSDIFSLGILFHELLTGRTPYQKIKEMYGTKEVKSSILELRPDLGKEAERLFLSMCAFDPRSRPTDLSQIKARIEKLL